MMGGRLSIYTSWYGFIDGQFIAYSHWSPRFSREKIGRIGRRSISVMKARSGVFIDLGTVQEPDDLTNSSRDIDLSVAATTYSDESIYEWRAKHWVVLIDDEPSIRLAIGDYLHSMGYKFVTACDGPLSFLEMLLWTCGCSFLEKDPNQLSLSMNNECPPWIDETYADNKHPWRLPSIVISDIRMPGGIDGVQLLELLREQRSAANELIGSRKTVKNNTSKTKRRRKKKSQPVDEVDIQIIDPIILNGWVEFATPIATPVDHAKNILDSIYKTLEYCKRIDTQRSIQNCPDQIHDIPVILLTAKAMISDRIKGYKAGADGYLPKPFRPEELLRLVDNLMRRQERECSSQLIDRHRDILDNTDGLGGDEVLGVDDIKEISNKLSEIKKLLQGATLKPNSSSNGFIT
jgi:CheY-like chemotaxis protein